MHCRFLLHAEIHIHISFSQTHSSFPELAQEQVAFLILEPLGAPKKDNLDAALLQSTVNEETAEGEG
jgi:hypothetical protein